MKIFLAIITGIILLLGAVASVPLANRCMDESNLNMAKLWRWRVLAVLVLLAGVGCVALAFTLIPRILD